MPGRTSPLTVMTTRASSLALFFFLILPFFFATAVFSFQSDELLVDDDEFGLEGGRSSDPLPDARPLSSPTARRRSSDSSSDPDSRIQFTLEHAFGDSDFVSAGTFTARLKTTSHGGQTLTKLWFSRNAFGEKEKQNFKTLLEDDDFYRIRLPSNVLSMPGREYVVSSMKARCLPRDALDEYFVIHTEGVNILAVNYGSPGLCHYAHQFKLPTKWSFKSHTVLKNSEQAPRTPVFSAEVVGEEGEGEELKPPEKSFWAKYWMYLIPLGVIILNAMTQARNLAEEGQPGSQTQAIAGQSQGAAVRRR